MEAELNITLMQLEKFKTPANQELIENISKEAKQIIDFKGEDMIKRMLSTCAKQELRGLTVAVNASNNSEERTRGLYKVIFDEHWQTTSKLANTVTYAEKALKSASQLAFLKSYASDSGYISWESYKSHLLDVVLAESAPAKKEGCFQS